MSKYPDISHHHPVSNWNKIKSNCPFIISKATEGQTYVDSTLKSFIKNCESKKIPYWLYTYLRKGNEKAQAKFMVNTCKSLIGDYFVGYILDVEENNTASGVKEALEYINGLGYKTMIYTMYAQYDEYKNVLAVRGENCAWWEARYGKNNGQYNSAYPCHSGVDLHQFTSQGTCPGITDKIDLNRITGTNGKKINWFTSRIVAAKKYEGNFPKLPDRGYYKFGDGYKQLTDCVAEIKKLQRFLNWYLGINLKVDGKYGLLTQSAVEDFQKQAGLKVDGLFGSKSLAAAKKVKR